MPHHLGRRIFLSTLGTAAAAVAGGVAWGRFKLSVPGWSGPTSDHFDGTQFHFPGETPGGRGLGDVLRWQIERDPGPWSDESVSPEPGPPPPARVGAGAARVTVVNHATVLIQADGFNVLTDPIWSERASPVGFAGPKRHRAPGLRFDDLPPIDLILLSHNHYDHLDLPTLHRLVARDQPKLVTSLGNRAYLEAEGIPVTAELDWWDDTRPLAGLTVTAVPMRHFSGRGLSDRDRTLWCGFVVHTSLGPILFGADSGEGPHFAQIADRFGPMRLSLLPIGAYRPRWFMGPVHMDPAGAVRAHRALRSQQSIAIHYGTFSLADDGETEPLTDLAEALHGGTDASFLTPPFGHGTELSS